MNPKPCVCFFWQVRVNALLCLADLVQKLDKHAVLGILQTIQCCTAVDHSAPTLMCTLGVANSIFKQYGVEFVAEHVLPLLTPLLTAQQLNVQQFAKYMLFVKDILRMIEEKRGVMVTSSGNPEVKPGSFPNGLQSEALSKTSGTVAPASKSSASWDEDWGPITKGHTSAPQPSTSNSLSTPILGNQPNQSSSQSELLTMSTVYGQRTQVSYPPSDLEWPPRVSSGVIPQLGDGEQSMYAGTSSASGLNDIDPFADWPPRSTSTSSHVGTSNNGTLGPWTSNYSSNMIMSKASMNPQTNGSNSWALNNQNSFQGLKPSQGMSTLSVGSLNNSINPQNSIGFLKQNQNTSTLSAFNVKNSTDLESMSSSSRNGHSALKLAPPPSTVVGRGRGRGSGGISTSKSSNAKQAGQPPLLDLL
uniref:SCY1-like protein 2 n=2 Tax=Rhizophora mucronata TaxID=61149 RepID=A0A2P2LXF4_RHIMU